MDRMVEFNQLEDAELMMLEGGCGLCTAGAMIGGAATGAGTVLALASNPVGWAVGAGALIGAGIGYLITL